MDISSWARRKTAMILMIAALLSRLLGLVRDMVITSFFGQGDLTDAYFAAFTLPDLFYLLLAGAALGPVLVPILSGYIVKGERDKGVKLVTTIIVLVFGGMIVCVLIGSLFTPALMKIFYPGYFAAGDPRGALTVDLTRIMLWQGLFMALAAIGMGFLQSNDRYVAPAAGSLVYNIITILFGVLFYPYLGIYGFSMAVTIGALLYFIVEVPSMRKEGWRLRNNFDIHHESLKPALIRTLPILLAMGVQQINYLVSQNLASGLETGVVSALHLAQRLSMMPVGIFAVPLAVALFASMSRFASSGEMSAYMERFRQAFSDILFYAFPAAGGLIILREPLIALMYERNAFTAADTERTALFLLFYCIGLIGYALLHIVNRSFYALQDTKTPVIIGGVSVALNIVMSLALLRLVGGVGLPLAYSLAGLLNMLILCVLLRHRVGNLGSKRFWASIGTFFVLTLITMLAVWLFTVFCPVDGGSVAGRAVLLFGGLAVGAVIYLGGERIARRFGLGRMPRRFSKE